MTTDFRRISAFEITYENDNSTLSKLIMIEKDFVSALKSIAKNDPFLKITKIERTNTNIYIVDDSGVTLLTGMFVEVPGPVEP